jgi:hypothetical protein
MKKTNAPLGNEQNQLKKGILFFCTEHEKNYFIDFLTKRISREKIDHFFHFVTEVEDLEILSKTLIGPLCVSAGQFMKATEDMIRPFFSCIEEEECFVIFKNNKEGVAMKKTVKDRISDIKEHFRVSIEIKACDEKSASLKLVEYVEQAESPVIEENPVSEQQPAEVLEEEFAS